MEDENGRKRLGEHLLGRIADARQTEPHRLQVGDPCECVFYGVHRVMLLEVSHNDICVGKMGGGKTDLDFESE